MSSKKFALLIVGLLIALAFAYFTVLPQPEAPESQGTAEVAENNVETSAEDAVETPSTSTASTTFDLESALQPRILGDVNSPIKISEHSSFTCGHCGKFHRQSFKTVKAELIDTGKAYLVFSDFPLNAPALHASMITRCAPVENYFDFVQHLFEDQENWAFEKNYLDILKEKAAQFGLNEDGFKTCMNNEALQQGIVAGAKAAQTQWEVSSTPSFVVNNKTLLSGAMSPTDFIAKVTEAANAPSEEAPSEEGE